MDSYRPHFEVKCLRTLVEQWCWWNGWETFLPSQHKIGFLRSWTFTVPFNQRCTFFLSDSLRYWSDFLIFLKKTVRGINDGHDEVSQKRVFLVFFSWNGFPHVPTPHTHLQGFTEPTSIRLRFFNFNMANMVPWQLPVPMAIRRGGLDMDSNNWSWGKHQVGKPQGGQGKLPRF